MSGNLQKKRLTTRLIKTKAENKPLTPHLQIKPDTCSIPAVWLNGRVGFVFGIVNKSKIRLHSNIVTGR
jgi:hypothetical protein